MRWKDVRELVVGRIRVTPESDIDDDLDGSVLSLGLFPGEYIDSASAMSGIDPISIFGPRSFLPLTDGPIQKYVLTNVLNIRQMNGMVKQADKPPNK